MIGSSAIPETEPTLVEWAECATAAQIDRVVAGRRSLDKKTAAARYVTWSYEDDGTFLLRAKLTPEEGALVVAALQSARKVLRDDENGSAEPLRVTDGSAEPLTVGNADAFVAMAETTLAHGPTPVEAGDRHVVMVHLNAATGEAQLDGGPVLSEDSKQLVLCGASFADVGLGAQREVLYMGRLYREPNRAQRRALAIRDGGCTFPGCTQRIFVDAHHLEEWENGGRTDIDNLLLLCRFHHNAIHHRGFTVKKGPRQTFRFFNPDGIELIAAPKPATPSATTPTHGASGTPITPDTPIPNWDGHHPDYATAIEGLMWLEENAHNLDPVAV
ncbi:MAG TPA: DUF222 domain-containing protein [Acidimicrobiales bacterium]|nr:DUF222 domain-containing protein [Acidimicrobiales bacterium]